MFLPDNLPPDSDPFFEQPRPLVRTGQGEYSRDFNTTPLERGAVRLIKYIAWAFIGIAAGAMLAMHPVHGVTLVGGMLAGAGAMVCFRR